MSVSKLRNTMNGVSLIVPTYNRAELLEKALASVQELVIPPGWVAEVLVIDNNSNDRTRNVVENKRWELLTRYCFESRQGLNYARNRGIQESKYEHLVYLDDDMEIDPQWVEGYVEIQEQLKPDAVTGPVDPSFENDPPSWMCTRTIQSVSSAYAQRGAKTMILPPSAAHQLPGCNFAVRRGVALEIGGFNPLLDRSGNSLVAGGDWEFGRRLSKSGKSVAYNPKCRISHFISSEKMSVRGLKRRWWGFGATTAILQELEQREVESRDYIRLVRRMCRFYLAARLDAILGRKGAALQKNLQGREICGYLYTSFRRKCGPQSTTK